MLYIFWFLGMLAFKLAIFDLCQCILLCVRILLAKDTPFSTTSETLSYQEIHPYCAFNIDSVKINTSLIMTREWKIWTEIIQPVPWHEFGGILLGNHFSVQGVRNKDWGRKWNWKIMVRLQMTILQMLWWYFWCVHIPHAWFNDS